ncbi:hypothetical protein CIK72_06705 [Brachybacterium alimentarium]|nr:hypothetical protein CIK73_09225 [Brachybacterium alimentarium]RCS81094.1 hypothetical protein CIK72_06705 [Brachybacterium alimentarium]
MCSTRSSYCIGIVATIEVKSRLPPDIAYPMTDHTVKKTMPSSTLVSTTSTLLGVMNMSSSPRNRPIHRPDSTPWPITRPQVFRPVTRSISLRSVPTMRVLWTGKWLSASVSTTAWTS